jgi:hypothetical protein
VQRGVSRTDGPDTLGRVSRTDGPDTLGKQDLLRFKGGKVSDEVISIVLSCRTGNPIWKFGAQTKWEPYLTDHTRSGISGNPAPVMILTSD